jgi:hypothetical protein
LGTQTLGASETCVAEAVAVDEYDCGGNYTLAAFEAWRPDAGCVAAGDQYAGYAIRCYAAAGLSDAAVRRRYLRFAGEPIEPPEVDRHDAAVALARHAALAGAPKRQIIAWLTRLTVEVPCWPDDPDEIAAIARAAVREMAE